MTEAPFSIDPLAVYREHDVVLGLGVSFATLRSARRSGRLAYTRAGRHVLILGQHLIDWLSRGVKGQATEQEVACAG